MHSRQHQQLLHLFKSLAFAPIVGPSGAIPKLFLITVLEQNMVNIQDPLLYKYVVLELQKLAIEDIDEGQFVSILSNLSIKGKQEEYLQKIFEEISDGAPTIGERQLHNFFKINRDSEETHRRFEIEKDMLARLLRREEINRELFMRIFSRG